MCLYFNSLFPVDIYSYCTVIRKDEMISIFLNLPRLDLWPKMGCILENVLCALEKKVKFIVWGWNVLKISIRSNWSIVSFKVCVSLLIFCLVDLSIGVSGVLKSPTIIVLLLISSFILVSICLTYWGAPMFSAYIFIIVISSLVLTLWSLCTVLLYLSSRPLFQSLFYLIWVLLLLFSFDLHLDEIFFFQPFAFSLYVSLWLRWVSFRQHI